MGCRPRARSVLHCHGVLALRDRSLSEALLAVLEGVRLVSRQFRKRRLALWAALVRVQLYKLVASTCNITLRPPWQLLQVSRLPCASAQKKSVTHATPTYDRLPHSFWFMSWPLALASSLHQFSFHSPYCSSYASCTTKTP